MRNFELAIRTRKEPDHTEVITSENGAELVTLHFDEYGHDTKQFIEFIISKYDLHHNNPASVFSVVMLRNMIDYGKDHYAGTKDRLAYFLFDIIPDVEFKEVVAFFSNDVLTTNAKYEKYEYWDSREGGTT